MTLRAQLSELLMAELDRRNMSVRELEKLSRVSRHTILRLIHERTHETTGKVVTPQLATIETLFSALGLELRVIAPRKKTHA